MEASSDLKKLLYTVLSVVGLGVVIVVTVYPFLLMLMGSFKEDYEIFSLTPSILPRNGFRLTIYKELIENWPIFRGMFNSIVVTVSATALTSFFCTLAGYTFAKYKFPFKNVLFMILIASMMIPSVATLVPTYLIVRGLGGVNKYWPLIVPGAVPAFGIFMMRQFAIAGVPTDAIQYARVEGAREGTILMKIAFPMLAPGIFSLAILTFMNTWNDFLWPIIITTDRSMLTVTALLRSIGDATLGNFGILLAATTLSTLPIIILYVAFHKQLIKGILEGMGKE